MMSSYHEWMITITDKRLMPGGNKKVTCVTFLLPPDIKGLKFWDTEYLIWNKRYTEMEERINSDNHESFTKKYELGIVCKFRF